MQNVLSERLLIDLNLQVKISDPLASQNMILILLLNQTTS